MTMAATDLTGFRTLGPVSAHRAPIAFPDRPNDSLLLERSRDVEKHSQLAITIGRLVPRLNTRDQRPHFIFVKPFTWE